MAVDTFGKVWRLTRLHCPLAPPLLVQSWVKDVYQDICDHWAWSWLRAQSQILTSAQKSGTADVTRGSATVTGGTITFATTDIDRQFRSGSSSPIYTITDVDVGLNTATLDAVYGGTTAAGATCFVLDAYITMPDDFARFIAVLDPPNNWQLRYWVTEEELNSWDAQRSATGTPRVLASRRFATTTAQAGKIQYELWPFQQQQYVYPMYYYRRPENLTDDTAFLGPLAYNGNVLITGALAKAAAWPGLDGKKNPYFNLGLAEMKMKEFQHDVGAMENRDQEIYPTDWETESWINRISWAPLDARFIQAHDVGMLGQGSGLGVAGASLYF